MLSALSSDAATSSDATPSDNDDKPNNIYLIISAAPLSDADLSSELALSPCKF